MKLGVIGLKGHQSVVFDGARQLGDVELVAVAETDRQAVAALKEQEPLARDVQVYDDWRRLLDHALVDICCVSDENGVRAEQLIALAGLGVHIVAEKPLTTTLADLERVERALAASASRLTMLLTMRHEPQYALARRLVRSGAIGEPCQVSSQKSYRLETRPDWFRDRERLGGMIPYIGIHALDLMRWTTGLDYTHVAAFHGRQGKPDVLGQTESQGSVLLRLANGGSAAARLDYLRPETAPTHGDDRLRIAGTEGVIEAQSANPRVLLVTSQHEPHEIEPPATTNLFAEFVQALRESKPSPIGADDCLYATRVSLQAREAADSGKLIDLAAPTR